MPSNPFKATKYTVDRITNAIAADVQGNLIFRDIPNPEGVTLSQLIRGLIASNVSFDYEGTFFSGSNSVQDALEQLNQFAYISNTGRFIVVDPTIGDVNTVAGSIYNDIQTAVSYANTLLFNGYNTVNIMLMGTHSQIPSTEISTDLGVFEYDELSPIEVVNNGIKFIGVGRPTIRFKNITTASSLFQIGDSTVQELSVLFQDISFEFVNCENVSAIKVLNSPTNSETKDKNGLIVDGVSVSFVGGTNEGNRLVDVSNSGTKIESQISLKNIKLGSITSVTPSITPIEMIYINHNDETVVNIENMEFLNLNQPNPVDNVAIGNVTSFTAIKVAAGKVFVNNTKLDEKMYWNNETFSAVKTLFLDASGTSQVVISNVSIIRDEYNTTEEVAGGITTLHDWIVTGTNTKVNAQGGFDEIFDVTVIPIQTDTPSPSATPSSGSPTTGSPTTGSPTTGSGFLNDVKPVKGFYNQGEIVLGLGDKNELRLGKVEPADIANFATYTSDYGIPFAINPTDKKIYFAIDGTVHVIGGGSYTINITTDRWVASGSDYELVIPHNLSLRNKYAFNISVFNDSDEKIEPYKVVAVDENSSKIVMQTNDPVWVTIFS